MANNPFEKANERNRITELLKERNYLSEKIKVLERDLSEARMKAGLFATVVKLRDKEIDSNRIKTLRLKRKVYKISKIIKR